jgi:hypothetical protein
MGVGRGNCELIERAPCCARCSLVIVRVKVGLFPADDLIERVKAARAAGAFQRLRKTVVPDGKPKPLTGDAAKASTDLSR